MTPQVALTLMWLAPLGGGFASQERETEAPLVERVALEASTNGPLSLNFPDAVSLQEALHEWGRRTGITVLFDEAFRDTTITLDLQARSAEEALEKITIANRVFYKILDPKTIIVAPDNAQKHRQYDEMLLHTFRIAHSNVNEIANMFRTIAGIQRVQPNDSQRSVTVRATADQLLVAQSILLRNDRPAAELAFAVEILAADSALHRAPGLVLSSEEFLRFKSENDAAVLFSQTIRVTERERAVLAVEAGHRQRVTNVTSPDEPASDTAEESKSEAPPERRAIGIELSLHPEVTLQGDIRLALTVQATAKGAGSPAESEPVPFRTRVVSTTASLKDGETTLVQAMFGVADFGDALDVAPRAEGVQPIVVVAITASLLSAAAISEALPPLRMGTEQQVRVPRP